VAPRAGAAQLASTTRSRRGARWHVDARRRGDGRTRSLVQNLLIGSGVEVNPMGDAMRANTSSTVEAPQEPHDTERHDPNSTQPHATHPWPELDVIDGGRMPLRFGEFLVQEGAIDRAQLFRAMQIQDRLPQMPIGQCVVALGYLTMSEVEWMYQRFATTLVAIEP
jgi:hypothetical protein